MMQDYCEQCHEDVTEDWSHSAHRLSSFNNPAYRFSVRETRRVSMEQKGNAKAARFCAGCHDPVPFFSGALDGPGFDDQTHHTADAGITCSACHAITRINSPRGNADYTIAEPVHYPFTFVDNVFLQWINRQLIKAKPAFHKKTFMKDFHRSAEFCGTCHKVHLPEEVNNYKWLRGQNHYDAYLLSGVSGHGISSFYYPPRAVHRCAQCHMPLAASTDFGAQYFDASEELKVHDHLFAAANTALPYMLGLPEHANEARRAFLSGALRVDIFGIKQGGVIDGTLSAPIRPEIPVLEPGRRYLLETVIRTVKLGHLFTQGTADSNEIWMDVTVTSGGRVIGRSGARDEDGEVDPWSHFVNAYVLDRHGNRIDRRNGQDIFVALYNHQIPPGAADVVHYLLDLPRDISEPVTVEVKLQYRKFDTTYMRYIQGEAFVANDLPITTLAVDRVTFPLAANKRVGAGQPRAVEDWMRWNDYGIGLLRKGSRGSAKGELRQAERAFSQVERLGRAEGALNLARTYLKEGRLEDAGKALRRAAEQGALPWSVVWFSAQVNKQNGFLDEAIAQLRRIVTTDFQQARRREFDFSQDYRVLNELGQTLFELAKQERGEQRKVRRETLLQEAGDWFRKTLAIDPENVSAHYNLALICARLGKRELAREHRALHMKYKPDDNGRERAVAIHRLKNPAADHAAEAVVIYDLRRSGAYGLSVSDTHFAMPNVSRYLGNSIAAARTIQTSRGID
jgi:tetratricopeptide (TPR) repeat protein